MNGKIIMNSEVFQVSYLPKRLIYREVEYNHLRRNIENQVNTIIVGPVGSGKTSIIKRIMADMPKEDIRYVNCTTYDTEFSVLREILSSSRLIIYRSVYELVKRLAEEANRKRVWVCFDNFMRLKNIGVISKVMSLGVNVILVSNVKRDILALNRNTLSNIPNTIFFSDYTTEQSYEILKQRAESALERSSFTDNLLRVIAEMTNGNMTLALNMLRMAALRAESEDRDAIEPIDLDASLPYFSNDFNLNADEQLLYGIVKEKEQISSHDLYALYEQHSDMSKGERSFRNYMGSLCAKGFVKAIGEKRGRVYEIMPIQKEE